MQHARPGRQARPGGTDSTITTIPMATAPDRCQAVRIKAGVKNLSPNTLSVSASHSTSAASVAAGDPRRDTLETSAAPRARTAQAPERATAPPALRDFGENAASCAPVSSSRSRTSGRTGRPCSTRRSHRCEKHPEHKPDHPAGLASHPAQ